MEQAEGRVAGPHRGLAAWDRLVQPSTAAGESVQPGPALATAQERAEMRGRK